MTNTAPWEDYQESAPWEDFAPKKPKLQPEPAINPTDGMSNTDKLLSGTGSAFVNTGMGLKQAGLWAGNKAGLVSDNTVANYQKEVDRERQLQNPLLDTGYGTAGNILGNVAVGAAGGQALAPLKAAQGAGWLARGANAVVNGVIGGSLLAGAQPVHSGETRLDNTIEGAQWGALGGGAGHVLGSGLGRIAKGASEKLSAPVQDLIEYAKSIGVQLHPSQLTDSKFVKALASQSKYWPGSGFHRGQMRQQGQFNNAVANEIGVNANKLTDPVMSEAKKGYSKLYQEAYDGVDIAGDKEMVSSVKSLLKEAKDDLLPEQYNLLRNQVASAFKAFKFNGGDISGKQYTALRTKLGKISASHGKGSANPLLGEKLGEFKTIVEDTAKRSLPQDKIATAKEAERLYRNYQAVEKSLKQVSGASGDVRPTSLWPIVNGKYKSTPEMRELARFGQVIKDPIGDSGTAARLDAQSIWSAALLAAPRALVGQAVNSPLTSKIMASNNSAKAINGVARLIENKAPALKKLPGLLAPAMAGGAMLSTPMMSPEQFDAKLNSDLSQGRITKAQAANQLDAYLQTIKGQQGVDSVRAVYKQFPNWSAVMDN